MFRRKLLVKVYNTLGMPDFRMVTVLVWNEIKTIKIISLFFFSTRLHKIIFSFQTEFHSWVHFAVPLSVCVKSFLFFQPGHGLLGRPTADVNRRLPFRPHNIFSIVHHRNPSSAHPTGITGSQSLRAWLSFCLSPTGFSRATTFCNFFELERHVSISLLSVFSGHASKIGFEIKDGSGPFRDELFCKFLVFAGFFWISGKK